MSKRIIVYGTASEQALVQTIVELERENAALNHALNIAQTELRLNGCAKAADEVAKLHDAARKEAQP